MDSMRSLNRSLPSASNAATSNQSIPPPEQLMQAFKQAALSVTNLYKSAAGNHESIRQAGYQDCIDDLLKFLDKENLGLQDGEGWTIRQWATARYDSNLTADEAEDETETGSDLPTSLPAPRSSPAPAQPQNQPHQIPEVVHDTSSSSTKPEPQHQDSTSNSQAVFRFSAGHDTSMQLEPLEPAVPGQEQSSSVRVEVHGRPTRNTSKLNTRQSVRAARNIASTAGSKRKLPFPDISEIFNLNFDKKDHFDGGSSSNGTNTGGGGGNVSKRGRMV